MSIISRICGRSQSIIFGSRSGNRMELRMFRTKKRRDEHKFQLGLEKSPNTVGYSALKRPVLFGAVFTGFTISGCAVWQYENMREAARRSRFPTSLKFDELFGRKAGSLREEFRQWWSELPVHEKLFIPICALNCLVFAAWRMPVLQNTMYKWFAAHPGGAATCLPMLFSSFSHYSLLHLGMNMFVLHSFMGPVVKLLGQEQFLAVYLSSAVFTSLASYAYKIGSGRMVYSLGASGAICAILGIFGTLIPDARLQIVFLPMFTFSASTAIKGLMCMDAAGLVAGWTLFDHAAHLSGVLFGIFWCYAGSSLLWGSREPVVKAWHQIRTSQTKP